MERRRTALGQIEGRVRAEGDPTVARVLTEAWTRASEEDPDRLTHGFHSWPARMHWALANTVISAFDAPTVLDPFAGGGTVLIEARVLNRRSVGMDLNPLSEAVSRVKTRTPMLDERERFLVIAKQVAEASEARVRDRVPIHVELPAHETKWYAPHVLKELGGLLEEIRKVDDRADRLALAMVFSANLIKVSKQASDTAVESTERRIRKGLTTELFLRKASELEARWAELTEAAQGPPPKLYQGDIRRLPSLAKERRVDLVMTSPPYAGTYDYADHHVRRLAFLGLSDPRFRKLELGARRHYRSDDAIPRLDEELGVMLDAMAAVLKAGAHAVLVIGDAKIGERIVPAARQLSVLAPRHGFDLVASASQERWPPREEHLVALRRNDRAARRPPREPLEGNREDTSAPREARGRGERPRPTRSESTGKTSAKPGSGERSPAKREERVGRDESRDRGEGPRNERPRGDRPRDDRPRNERPRDDKPRGTRDEKPRDERPRNERPRNERPRNERPRNERPRNDRPRDDKPRGTRDEKPRDDRPRNERPRNDRPRDDKPRNDKPRDDRPHNEKPRDDRPRNERPRNDRPRDDKPRNDKPRNDKPRDDRPHNERPRNEKPRDDRPRNERPRNDRPRDDKPRNEPPRNDKPRGTREEKPRDERPRGDKPRPERPRYEKPREEKPRNRRSRGDQPRDPRGGQPDRPSAERAPSKTDEEPPKNTRRKTPPEG